MSFASSPWRTEHEQEAISRARKLAKRLRHAAVVARLARTKPGYGTYDVFDSWKPLDEGWVVVAFVSSTGKVVACAETE